jgi:CubicO group peptidase (beta-lactamase class C family)
MRTIRVWKRRQVLFGLFVAAVLAWPAAAVAQAGRRVPGDRWMRYAHVEEAGFDAARLEAARRTWEALPSSAFLVVADGAVVAAWGEVERRFMCHSVRKSFLSALYGIYWERGGLELNKTLADLGIDDHPLPLLETERQARILDLLKARSGVFHPAAYAGRTDSRPRGSEGPGRFFAYNNWDFNTLAYILRQETGAEVFAAFDEHFGRPLGMEDWRVSDGYYHYELDKSRYPAYPFRLSARDAARFGLLFAREGLWGDRRILSENWVRRSSALYSIDTDVVGYGFMWWVYREPRFTRHGMYAALGVGNQMIAVLPKSDMVIVNRANTYEGEGTPSGALLDLVEQVLAARTGAPAANPALVPLETGSDPRITSVAADRLAPLVGTWAYPPPPLGLPAQTTVTITAGDGHLVSYVPQQGTFRLYVQPDGSLHEEDSHARYLPVRDETGAVTGIADDPAIIAGALLAAAGGNGARAERMLTHVADTAGPRVTVAGAVVALLGGDRAAAERRVRGLVAGAGAPRVEALVNAAGYQLLRAELPGPAAAVFELNTRVFPDAWNTWDSLGEAHLALGREAEAIRAYERSLQLNPQNSGAAAALARIREGRRAPDRR